MWPFSRKKRFRDADLKENLNRHYDEFFRELSKNEIPKTEVSTIVNNSEDFNTIPFLLFFIFVLITIFECINNKK
jgi:hypothetical protein